MRAVIVTPEVFVPDSIKTALTEKNLRYDTTSIGEDGLKIGKLYDYDIILLDLMLLDIDGEVLRQLRAARMRTLILIRSGLVELDETIKGLGSKNI
jgi:two-component system cell cycle response regulator CtrA